MVFVPKSSEILKKITDEASPHDAQRRAVGQTNEQLLNGNGILRGINKHTRSGLDLLIYPKTKRHIVVAGFLIESSVLRTFSSA